jgi:hypothetical protein
MNMHCDYCGHDYRPDCFAGQHDSIRSYSCYKREIVKLKAYAGQLERELVATTEGFHEYCRDRGIGKIGDSMGQVILADAKKLRRERDEAKQAFMKYLDDEADEHLYQFYSKDDAEEDRETECQRRKSEWCNEQLHRYIAAARAEMAEEGES